MGFKWDIDSKLWKKEISLNSKIIEQIKEFIGINDKIYKEINKTPILIYPIKAIKT